MSQENRVCFTIRGNHEEMTGNAIPKLRMTQRGLWRPEARRYHEWGNYVRKCYWQAVEGKVFGKYNIKPFRNTEAKMQLKIYWANERHGDAEGIFGSIADALWANDKHLDGEFMQYHDKINPRVEVTIFLYDRTVHQ